MLTARVTCLIVQRIANSSEHYCKPCDLYVRMCVRIKCESACVCLHFIIDAIKMRKMLLFYFGIFEKSPVRANARESEQERQNDRVRDHIVNSVLVDPTGRVRMLFRLEKSSEIDIYYSANMEIVYGDLSGSMCKHPDYIHIQHTTFDIFDLHRKWKMVLVKCTNTKHAHS